MKIWLALAATALVAVVSLAWGVYLTTELDDVREEARAARSEARDAQSRLTNKADARVAEDLVRVRDRIDDMECRHLTVGGATAHNPDGYEVSDCMGRFEISP